MRSNEGGGSGAEESFVLFLELKTSLHALWPRLVGELEALRSAGYLSHLEGPRIVLGRLTVVVTMGDADMLETHGVDNAYNDVFFDTSLDELMLKDYESVSRMGGKIDSAGLRRVYSATTNFRDSVGIPRHGGFSRQQIEVIRAQARAANQRGLRVRYEEIPRRWRIREMVREILRQERAELIEEETV